VGRGEEQGAVHVRQEARVSAAAGVDVLDQDGAGRRTVTPPQLVPAGAVVGGKVQGAVDVGQAGGIGAGPAGVDVLDQDRAGRRAIASPQLLTIAVVGREQQRPVDIREVGGPGTVGGILPVSLGVLVDVGPGATRVDVLDKGGAGGRAVTLPQL